MLKSHALAGSLAGLAVILYVAFYVIATISPELFRFLFNAQFMGADLAPASVQFNFGSLFSLVVIAWLAGYVWGLLYNRLVK